MAFHAAIYLMAGLLPMGYAPTAGPSHCWKTRIDPRSGHRDGTKMVDATGLNHRRVSARAGCCLVAVCKPGQFVPQTVCLPNRTIPSHSVHVTAARCSHMRTGHTGRSAQHHNEPERSLRAPFFVAWRIHSRPNFARLRPSTRSKSPSE